jgi:hypothetical protein
MFMKEEIAEASKKEGAIETDLPRERLQNPVEQTLVHRLPSSLEFLLLVAPLVYSCWSLNHQSVREVSKIQVTIVSYEMMPRLGAGTELRSQPSGK